MTGSVSIVLGTPDDSELDRVAGALGAWQHDRGPLQLHPGDLGWFSLRGVAATAAAIRTWSRAGTILALGLLDGPQLLRLAVDPELCEDDELARQLAADVDDPRRGVLEAGSAVVEARGAGRLSRLLSERGWQPDEPWTPLRRDLTDYVPDVGLRVEVIGPDQVDLWVAVYWSAFRGSPFTADDRRRLMDRWLTMAAGPLYAGARSLTAFDETGNAVAVATVWPSGPGRPGLLEPVGVHRDHRHRGYGVAITLAAAAALREMGSSSALVSTPSANVAAVSAYAAAGFLADQPVPDLRRSA